MNQHVELTANDSVRIFSVELGEGQLNGLIESLLPDQGCIEVQRDVSGKEHAWHSHESDETLVILEGKVHFYWEGGTRVCEPGDVISLPSGVRHGSIALDGGATYLIAFQNVQLTPHG